jgi:hypothetical protein
MNRRHFKKLSDRPFKAVTRLFFGTHSKRLLDKTSPRQYVSSTKRLLEVKSEAPSAPIGEQLVLRRATGTEKLPGPEEN